MQENKVFSSNITRGQKDLQNNLFDLLTIVPAAPLTVKHDKEHDCDFKPRTDKVYIPKKRARFTKVKTVRDIRNLFETDVTADLSKELEKQQNILLKRITGGSSRDVQGNTKELARNMLKYDKPVSRQSWQMLMNLNPEHYTHPIQYVLWNGRCIRVNGSKGGKNKFLSNYDLAKIKRPAKKDNKNRPLQQRKKSILRSSLTIKFKPGPLSRKRFLDDSYQKYNVGNTEVVNLPKPGLDIRPKYGVPLEPTIAKFVNSLRDTNGYVSEKWAEYAVSALGTVKNSSLVQNDEPGVTFELNYKCNQERTLMRHDVIKPLVACESFNCANMQQLEDRESNIFPEVKAIMNEIIDSVEISLLQDKMFLEDENSNENLSPIESKNTNNIAPKEKSKKRFCELDRLDVTVIRLPEAPQDDFSKICNNAYCSLGCICTSLQCAYSLKQHCGRTECMFECKCDFTKYRVSDSFENDCPELIPGLINLDNEMSLKLAKEEQKFHQTVVVTGEKSILLKSERRNWKASKRYRDFYSNMCLKNDSKVRKVLSVVDVKLNCENIEPWCMVHNLYKCFCKGIFTNDVKTNTYEHDLDDELHEEAPTCSKTSIEMKRPSRSVNSERIKKQVTSADYGVVYSDSFTSNDCNVCQRVRPYSGRKYKNDYYILTHKKIIQMEQNDTRLHEKMLSIINNTDTKGTSRSQNNNDNSSNDNDLLQVHDTSGDNEINSICETRPVTDNENSSESNTFECEDIAQDRSVLNTGSNKNKLIAWLESSYKQYKRRLDLGIVKTSLEPPKHGKVALYPWEFVLSRYRERKNLFLISKHKPFRIFMAVDTKHSFFDNCINIDDIRFADLHKYPLTIKNLLTNATDLKDNFCILCGLSHCWELIGSVTKVTDQLGIQSSKVTGDEKHVQSFRTEDSKSESHHLSNISESTSDISESNSIQLQDVLEQNITASDISLESSKWFVMTVESDFSEIQFHNKGFFVKYESIIKAINVARMSEKTVRLSSQKCSEPQGNGPQFGIYAIPNANEYYVFIGPYEKDEPLGIETVKSVHANYRSSKKTRGVWITTKTIDNIKVIDNPQSFMPPKDLHPTDIVPLENEVTTNQSKDEKEVNLVSAIAAQDKSTPQSSPIKEQRKIVKPIKIRKKDGFYHLASSGLINQIKKSVEQPLVSPVADVAKKTLLLQNRNIAPKLPSIIKILPKTSTSTSPLMIKPASVSDDSVPLVIKPVAEIAPQIKIVDVYSESQTANVQNKATNKKPDVGMFILKPEEINKRLMENKMLTKLELPLQDTETNNPQMDQDIENFLATTVACAPNEDIFVISDEENSNYELIPNESNWRDVWIECLNSTALGWIRGRKNANNELSFEFPGFKFTEFYSEEEAFSKINQVLSRKIFVPANLQLEWHVAESEDELVNKQKLQAEELSPNLVLTKRGLRHKREIAWCCNKKAKKKKTSDPGPAHPIEDNAAELKRVLGVLDEQSKTLDMESDKLMMEMAKKSNMGFCVLQDNTEQVTHTTQN